MDNLIPIIAKLQDIFNTIGSETLELPQIVAVGTQSSGKSSVIENIIGKDFLPRGCGMVTRRPLILQLFCNENKEENKTNEYLQKNNRETFAKFLHKPDLVYDDFQDVHNEISAETNRILSNTKDVSSEPIILKIYSPFLVNLTIVDLPGLTKIPLGSQPIDIEKKIADMTLSYIQNKNSIILVVIPANIDIATSEALKMAASVDPNAERTIVCLTKLDLMDHGTNAYEVLSGKIIKMKLGIIGVVNRSQMDIENKKPIDKALESEEHFFYKNYPLLSHWAGTKYLVKMLNRVLLEHIQKCLPRMKERIKFLLHKLEILNANLGQPITDKKFTLINILTKFVAVYKSIVSGTHFSITTKELFGGSRIYYIYHESFCKNINLMDPLDDLDNNDILTAIRNSTGLKTSLFLPECAFELLVKKQVKKLELPSLNCVVQVAEEMLKIISQVFEEITEFIRFPTLKDQVFEIVKQVLAEEKEPTCSMITNLIKSEISYINTNHPDFTEVISQTSFKLNHIDTLFIPSLTSPSQEIKEMNETIKNEHKQTITETQDQRLDGHSKILTTLICSYLKIINHKFQDSVPKFITCFLIDKVIERLPNELVDRLLKDHLIDSLITESPNITSQRENNCKMISALLKADSIIADVKETQI